MVLISSRAASAARTASRARVRSAACQINSLSVVTWLSQASVEGYGPRRVARCHSASTSWSVTGTTSGITGRDQALAISGKRGGLSGLAFRKVDDLALDERVEMFGRLPLCGVDQMRIACRRLGLAVPKQRADHR